MTYSRACGSRVVHQLLNKTIQKKTVRKSQRGARRNLSKRGPRDNSFVRLP